MPRPAAALAPTARLSVLALGFLLAFVLLAADADAGKNGNGAMIVHADPALAYSVGHDVCGTLYEQHAPVSCETAGTRIDVAPEAAAVVWLLAAFHEDEEPGVTAMQFGIQHDLPQGQGSFVAWGPCGPSPLELPQNGFPDQPGGDLVGYVQAVYSTLFPFYWFAVHGVDASSYLATGPDPRFGSAKFADDSVPPLEDLVTRFGRICWYSDAGENDCPVPVPQACCLTDGSCMMLLRQDCLGIEGFPQGPATECDPASSCEAACCIPISGVCRFLTASLCADLDGLWMGYPSDCEHVECPQPAIGACCGVTGQCSLETEYVCEAFGWDWMGEGTDCDPNPCPVLVGACCFDDGDCWMSLEETCDSEGGNFLGGGTLCGECPAGACCIETVCTVLSPLTCEAMEGIFQGPGTDCDPNPCAPSPTRSVSWGRLKSLYR